MGNCCSNYSKIEFQSTLIANNEDEIEFPSYSSLSDDHLECLEKENNILRYITLVEYMNLLSYFNLDTATIPFEGPYKLVFSPKDKFLTNIFYEELFQSFIENTILRDRELGELEITFKEIFLELFKSLKLKLTQHYGNKNINITKRDLICLGTLFCKSSNIGKIKILFDIFKNEKEQFIQSEELNKFLLCNFLISSYCLISAKNKLSQINPMITEFPLEDLKSLLQYAELKDCEKLVKSFNFDFFDKNAYTWKDFKKKFEGKEEGFGWIFSTKGIRQKLEQNNEN